MDMDHSSNAQTQKMSNQTLENIIGCSKAQQDKKPKPQPEHALKCPRCDSTNTKFCYYNNYSLSQPRYFCKSCRRYWTKGGTLRNVPVGGGCRKNKRSSSSTKRTHQDHSFTPNPNSNPLIGLTPLSFDFNDLNLAFARLQNGAMGYDEHDLSIMGNNTNTSTPCENILGNLGNNPSNPDFLDALRSGFLGSHNNNNNSIKNLYFGYGNGENMGEVENNGNDGYGDMMLSYDNQQQMNIVTTQAVSMTTMKQELCNAREKSESNVLWGFPWQLNGEGTQTWLKQLNQVEQIGTMGSLHHGMDF